MGYGGFPGPTGGTTGPIGAMNGEPTGSEDVATGWRVEGIGINDSRHFNTDEAAYDWSPYPLDFIVTGPRPIVTPLGVPGDHPFTPTVSIATLNVDLPVGTPDSVSYLDVTTIEISLVVL